MKRKLLTSLKTGCLMVLLVAGLLFVPQPALGIFGFGDIVFDPTSYATLGHIWEQDISTTAKIVQEIEQMEKIYANGVQVYTLASAMSHSFDGSHKAEWLTVAQMAAADYTQDKYGENSNWAKTLNGNPALAQSAWSSATVPFSHGSFLDADTRMRPLLATMEALDGSSTKCLATISTYRANSVLNLAPILKLAIARADGTADTNSHIQQLNLLNAGNEQANNEQRAQGTVNSCIVEQQILASKMQRDQIADHLNYLGKVNEYQASEGDGWGGAAEALQAR